MTSVRLIIISKSRRIALILRLLLSSTLTVSLVHITRRNTSSSRILTVISSRRGNRLSSSAVPYISSSICRIRIISSTITIWIIPCGSRRKSCRKIINSTISKRIRIRRLIKLVALRCTCKVIRGSAFTSCTHI